jgi:hypothetical protein
VSGLTVRSVPKRTSPMEVQSAGGLIGVQRTSGLRYLASAVPPGFRHLQRLEIPVSQM